MVPLASAGAGFLLAVLWFDLMFDVQVLRAGAGEVPEPVLASIAAYYARVTTAARPMSRLIAAVMLVTLGALVAQVAGDDVTPAVAWVSLLLAAIPIGLAGSRTLPAAVRLGARADPPPIQSALARRICREHVVCFASIAALLILQLAAT